MHSGVSWCEQRQLSPIWMINSSLKN
jgi:hypothetical protein